MMPERDVHKMNAETLRAEVDDAEREALQRVKHAAAEARQAVDDAAHLVERMAKGEFPKGAIFTTRLSTVFYGSESSQGVTVGIGGGQMLVGNLRDVRGAGRRGEPVQYLVTVIIEPFDKEVG